MIIKLRIYFKKMTEIIQKPLISLALKLKTNKHINKIKAMRKEINIILALD